jgi:hypothetical protein
MRMLILATLLGSITAPAAADDPITIEWERSTLRYLGPGGYPRMIRLHDGAILFSYEAAGKSWTRRSVDNGQTWPDAVVAAQFEHGIAANPELLELDDGTVLLFYNERPRDGVHPYTIRMSVSADGGMNWTRREQPIYTAGVAFEHGCWEPAAVQLPCGEILLFFANENPYRETNEQEITLMRSRDRGATWSEPRTFSFRAGGRDGMPVPLLLHSGELVVAMEDNMHSGNGMFKPVILLGSTEADAAHEPIRADDTRRWPATDAIPPHVYAGAPYIRQLPSGHTILSCQSDEARRGTQMIVYIGDTDARNFTSPTAPFDLPNGVQGQWNSLFVRDDTTITALSSTTIDGRGGVWAIDGSVVPLRP